MNDFTYYGLFLDKKTRLELMKYLIECGYAYFINRYIFYKYYLDHCTLLHKNQVTENSENNILKLVFDDIIENYDTNMNIKIVGIGISHKVIAFKVDLMSNIECACETPHITIATFNGGTPTDVNSIKGWSELIQPIIIPVTLRKI